MPALGAIPEPASVAVAAHAALTSGVHGISAYGSTILAAANAGAAGVVLQLGSAAYASAGDFEAAGAAASAVGSHVAAADPHTQYGLLAGRAGGQTQIGGTASGENLTLQSTAHATRGAVQSNDPIVAPAGSTSLAGLRHAGMAVNTGWYAITANNLALIISGAERYRFGSAGHFGAFSGVSVGNPATPHAALMGISAGVARITTSNFSTRAELEVSDLDASGTLTCGSYTVATLPTVGTAARWAYASNGRKNGEGGGAGTGVMVFDDGTAWRACDTGATVAA